MQRWYVRSLMIILLGIILLGCNTALSPTTSTTPPSPKATVLPTPEPVSVVGMVSVVSDTVGMPGGVMYEGAVVFRVKNPNQTGVANEIPYRITLMSVGKSLFTSDGTNTVDVNPKSERLVVFTFPVVKTKPDAASVHLYSSPSLFLSSASFSDPSQWKVTQTQVQCGESVECTGTGDLTWNGKKPQTGIDVVVVVHQGASDAGSILAAGTGNTENQQVISGQTVPFHALLMGFSQPEPGVAEILPSTPFYTEFFVGSVAA